MTRTHEDPATRRVIDTSNPAYRTGINAANAILNTDEYLKVAVYVLDCEVMMADLVAEDPDVREHWGMYLVLKGMLDTFREYQQDRSD